MKVLNKYCIETDDSRLSLFLTKLFPFSVVKIEELHKYYPKRLRKFDMAAGLGRLYGDFGDISLS